MSVTRCRRSDDARSRGASAAMRRVLSLGLVGVLALAAAACGKNPAPRGSVRGCPEVGILADAAKITKFLPGSARDVTDTLYEADITDVSLDCDGKRDALELNLALMMTAELGPASQSSRSHSLRFFVAVLRGKEGIVKRIYRAPVEWPSDSRYAGIRHTVEGLTVPTDDSIDPESYEVLVGFDLVSDEVRYNRAQPGFQ